VKIDPNDLASYYSLFKNILLVTFGYKTVSAQDINNVHLLSKF
jgi:hypothetical protein